MNIETIREVMHLMNPNVHLGMVGRDWPIARLWLREGGRIALRKQVLKNPFYLVIYRMPDKKGNEDVFTARLVSRNSFESVIGKITGKGISAVVIDIAVLYLKVFGEGVRNG